MPLIVIDYACIIMFFVLLAGLVLVAVRQKPATPEKKEPAEVTVQPSPLPGKVTYGLLAVLFVLLLAVTWLSERENPRVH
jgi:hypothetical protein